MISMSLKRQPPGVSAHPARAAAAGNAGAMLSSIHSRAVTIRPRRYQKLAVACEADEVVYFVRAGALALSAGLPNGRRQILSILYPGDVFRSALTPSPALTGLSAVTASAEVWRLRWPTFEALAAGDSALQQLFDSLITDQAARLAMHIAIIGSLGADERVASFLVEIALRLGAPVAGGIAFEIPLTRTDIADYLALNADTVSRIMSRLRAKGVLAQSGRSLMICRDMKALESQSPFSAALQQICARARRAR